MSDKEKFKANGFIIFPNFFTITSHQIDLAKSLATNKDYKVGAAYRASRSSKIAQELYKLVRTPEIENIFTSLYPQIECQDIFITHEYRSGVMERNLWLHFDRLRCLKAMVYMVDVGEGDGPFSVVPGSHKVGRELRNNFENVQKYEDKRNRIRLDYPDLYEEPIKICGKAGTLILFDTDIFHKGGDIEAGAERLLIRSHWYPDHHWRMSST